MRWVLFPALLLIGVACSKRVVENPKSIPAFVPVVFEFVSSDASWALPESCQQTFGTSVKVVRTFDPTHCAAKHPSADATFFHCDGSGETKVVDKTGGRIYHRNLNSCADWLLQKGYVFFESSPPGAQVAINGTIRGRAPVWLALQQGRFTLECRNGKDEFGVMEGQAGVDLHLVCERQNQAAALEADGDFTPGEKASGVFLYIGGALISIGAILAPFLFF